VTAVKSSTDAADPGLLERYRLALIDAAKRYRRYPVQAMERGWQGRVEIRMVIGANGTIRDALIKTSSNYQILDDQALDMVKRGKPLTPIPAALHGREFTVDVPVIFELQTG
jgi:protein TonB